MMSSSSPLRGQSHRGISWAFPGLLLLLVLTAAGLPRAARAQFTGPSPVPSAATNIHYPVTTDISLLYPTDREIELFAGDQISVHLFEQTDYTSTVRITLDGSVDLPLIGVVHIAGLRLHAAERAIAQRLIDAGMYRNPQVSIQVLESPNQIVTVIGEMHGVVPTLGGQKRLYDVLSATGGLTSLSSHVITIDRPGVPQPIVIDLGQDPQRSSFANVPVFARDTIVVSRVGVVYVLGAFKNQGAIPIQPTTPLTLMQATALANGAGYEGKYDDLRIVRTVGLNRQVVHVNISKVWKGEDPDPILQADDIVYLPTSAFKAAVKGGGIGTALGILSLLTYTITIAAQ